MVTGFKGNRKLSIPAIIREKFVIGEMPCKKINDIFLIPLWILGVAEVETFILKNIIS